MPQLQLTDDELATVVGAADSVTGLVEQIREWITQGHRAAKI